MTATARYAEQKALTKKQFKLLREILESRRSKLIDEAEEQLDGAREEATLRMSDEVDLASAEYDQAFEHRLRDREKGLLKKVEKVLRRMDEGEYDECETCGNYIGVKRLEARPEATLCIECKEEQEALESKFKKRRDVDTRFPFK